MKQYILTIITLMLFYTSKAQDIVNGNFLINCGGSSIATTCPIVTIAPGCINNWERSHGAPELAFSDRILFNAGTGKGCGMIGGYLFCPGQSYNVSIFFKAGILDDPTGTFIIKASTGITASSTVPVNCLEVPPSPSLTATIGIMSSSQISNAIALSTPITFSFTCSMALDNLWLFATANDHFMADVDWVSIEKVCADKTIVSSPTANETIQGYGNIFAGSSYGFFSTPVYVTGRTIFDAGYSIELHDNFIASPGTNDMFIAQITTCNKPSCTNHDIGGDGGSGGKTGTIVNNRYDAASFSLYPNPSNGSFAITLPNKEDYNIHITNLIGITVYESTLHGGGKTEIHLKEELTSGTYIVQISNNTSLRFMQKITVIK